MAGPLLRSTTSTRFRALTASFQRRSAIFSRPTASIFDWSRELRSGLPGRRPLPPSLVACALSVVEAGCCSLMGILLIGTGTDARSEEHTSELQSLMRISYAVFCLKNKTTITTLHDIL